GSRRTWVAKARRAMRPNLRRKSSALRLRQYRPGVSGKAAKRSRGSRAYGYRGVRRPPDLALIAKSRNCGEKYERFRFGSIVMAQTEVAPAATRTFGLSTLVNAITSTGDLQLAYSAFRITLG